MSYIGSKPANKPITSADIEDSIIVAADLAANSVDSSELVDGSIDTSHLGASQVTTAKIAADNIVASLIADDAIDSEHYTDGSIDTAHINDLNVTTGKLAADAVTAAKLADDAVVTANIVDLNVTTGKIAADAITGAKIADDAIGAEHIDDNAIGLAAMAGGTDGNIISYDASGNPVAIATGSDGEVLTSAGAGQPPAFEAAAAGGKIGQVLQTHKADEFTHSNTSYQEISTFRRAITPSASSSKILINAQLNLSMSGSNTMWVRLIRLISSTETIIAHSSGDGSEDAAFNTGMRGSNPTYEMHNVVINYLDSPSTTSECTYYLVARVDGNAIYVNRVGASADRGASSNLTAMEVLA